MKKTIQCGEYQLPSSCIKGKQELTIAFLTDLHDQVTGEDGRIFHLLKEQEPDLVLVGGDVIVGKKGCDTSKAVAFLKRLSDNYPYFYASGIMNNVFQNIRIYGRSGKPQTALKELSLIRLRNQKYS